MTVEDSSPLITYLPAGSWTDTPSNDPLASSYSGGSYHTSAVQGATATITFTGTGLSIFGGRRSNYGTYSLSVDGQTVSNGNAQSNDPSTQQLLGTVSRLPYGQHTAVLTNTGSNPIDIDWVDFEAQIGTSGTVIKKTFDDNDSAIQYLPSPSDWQTNQNSAFADGTLHFSSTAGASASITFSGDAVAVYGTVSPDHANIRMTLDGQSQLMPGGSGGMASVVHPQWYKSDLGPGQHTLVLSGDVQSNTGPFIDLDSINVFDTTSSATTPSVTTTESSVGPNSSATAVAAALPSSSTTAPASDSSKSGMSTGATVGIAFGTLIAVIFLVGLLGFLLKRRRNNAKTIEKSMIAVSPVLPMQRDPRAMEAGMMKSLENPVFPLPPPRASLRHSIAPSYYSDPQFSGHSRDASMRSDKSTTPLVPPIPTIVVSEPQQQSRFASRKPPPTNSGLNVNGSPARPNKRPPTLDFVIMEN
ncbi:A type blood alpha-D-galactosamine galactosaminidase [Psilocybe cubensis]|uniref:Transmembrane protein n=2 Tax=Psilocybe cubensis TaxID=181762 RepID=A0A8H8CP51_PSICU|nr:A type blood alpha-D-galactosamine galactosaminidase [Psilocybe cubensis]KAH9485090.1 A type blood alpha-D-galactosamine galactosaminidase [Psilocybe cubensis]